MLMLRKLYSALSKRFPFVVRLRGWLQDITGLHFRPARYRYLDRLIREMKPGRMMEIGTWDGRNAKIMIREALKYRDEVHYYGFDLFEDVHALDLGDEFNRSKVPPPERVVENRLRKTGARIHLIKGDTQKTLPENVPHLPVMDLVFIDGGHSLETIRSDWQSVKKLMDGDTVVVFDDYWNREDAGCKKIIEEIDRETFEVEILPVQDTFKKEWGLLKINFVRVSRKEETSPA